MASAIDVEDVRVNLEQLMNETSIRGSIRKQIETLRERNRTHKKRINIENRVLKNLRSQGVLDKIIDHLTSNKSINDESDVIKESEIALRDEQPAVIDTNDENNEKKIQRNSSPSQEVILEHYSSGNGPSTSSRKSESLGSIETCRSKEEKKRNSDSFLSKKKKKYKKEIKEKSEMKITLKSSQEDSEHSINSKIPKQEISNFSKYKHKRSDTMIIKSKSEGTLPQSIRTSHDSPYFAGDGKTIVAEKHECKNERVLVKINPRKRHLHFEILQGKAFLDHLLEESFSMFVLFLNFRGQRFWTQPVPCKSQPNFDAGFLYELHVNDDTHMARPSHLLNINDKIHIVLVRILPSGEKVLVSSHYFEWRQILFAQESQKTFSVDLMGVGAESSITIGVIDIRITLIPKLLEPLSEKAVLSKIQVQKRKQEEQDRIFLVYAKTWWKEYLSLRPEHSQRTVKLFHQDENAQNRAVFHFVQVLKVGRPLLELPQEAAWFVSLIQLEPPSLLGAVPAVEQWCVPHTFLCLKKGGCENHATLLCSLFLGFGLDAFVCIGTKEGNIPWAWVATISQDNYATFWESTTGARYRHDPHLPNEPYQYSYPYKTVGCLFNHKSFYANIQESDKVKLCHFNVRNKRLWKNLSEAAISSVVRNFNLSLMPGWTEPFIHSQEMETELRTRITEHRENIGLPTRWDVELCHLIAPVLALYEMEHRMGLALRKEEIDDLINKNVPEGFALRALPLRVAVVDKKRVLGVCLRNAIMESIVTCPEPGCKLALRVHTYVYPENVLSVWLIIANKFRSE